MITTYDEFILENNNITTPEDFGITKYEWVNGLLDCYQHVNLARIDLKKIPFSFGKIDGYFYCGYNPLTSLEGCPHTVNGGFNCSSNRLTSLKYCPHIVNGNFDCSENELTNLKYCPKSVGGGFGCYGNKLRSLNYCPKYVGGNFYCGENKFTGIEKYPLCDIVGTITGISHFQEINDIVKNNKSKFIPLFNNKIAFHQMVMRIDPSLIQYYKTITPPTKKTIL